MISHTTPAMTLRINGIRLSSSDRIWVSIRQRRKYDYVGPDIELTNATIELEEDSTIVSFRLTQEHTSQLVPGDALVQVNWMTTGGVRGATTAASFHVGINLLDRVIS